MAVKKSELCGRWSVPYCRVYEGGVLDVLRCARRVEGASLIVPGLPS